MYCTCPNDKQNESHTELVEHKGVGLHAVRELVRLTHHQNRYIERRGNQRHLRGADRRHHMPIRKQTVSTYKFITVLSKVKHQIYTNNFLKFKIDKATALGFENFSFNIG